ncbi:MAG: ribokinase [Synergistales bacterium]|nr:ribokinase [Synergistales bacterium]
MDLIIEAERLPQPGETLTGGVFRTAGGGKGANQAVGTARMGAQTSLIGAVGDDRFGHAMQAALTAEGIDCSALLQREDTATGVACISLLPGGENAILVAPGANGTVTEADARRCRASISRTDVMLTQLELPVPTVVEALRVARETGVPTLFDPAPAERLPDEIWRFVSIAVPNRLELATYTGFDDPERGARTLRQKGAGTVIVTLGADGALYCSGETLRHFQAFHIDPVDSTAAGDAFSAALAVSIAEGAAHDDAIRYAQAAGALTCRRFGAQPSLPGRAQIEAFLGKQKGRTTKRG